MIKNRHQAYWRANLKLIIGLLLIWFVVSFGCGILWVDFLNQYQFAGFKLGFWMAHQGAMLCFLLLIFIYMLFMNRLDKKYGVED